MTSEWKRIPFGEFISLQRGHDLPDDKRTMGNVPVVGSFGITGWHNEAKAKAPGLAIGRSGASIGVPTYTEVDYFPLNTCLYVTDFHGNHPRFTYYFAKNFDFVSFNSGSAQPSLNRNFLNPVTVEIPSLSEQKAIAHILGTLDEKIELNRKTNDTLEAIAKALFKSWFVDFDPVRAKAAGRPTGLPKDMSDLFPDSFEDSELGEIPKGWEIRTLGDLCATITKGTTPTSVGGKFVESGDIRFIKVESLTDCGNLIPEKFARIDEETHELLKRSQLKQNDILLSIAGTIGRTAVVTDDCLPSNTNQALAILRCEGLVDFVLQTIRTTRVQAIFVSKIVQAVQANLSLGEIKLIKCVVPPANLLNLALSQFEALRTNNHLRRKESAILLELRDTLLPKLISGDLRVPDAEAMVAEAGL